MVDEAYRVIAAAMADRGLPRQTAAALAPRLTYQENIGGALKTYWPNSFVRRTVKGMDTLTPLICDLLEWLAREPRTHAEVMDGWRTSCPRLPVWEEATDKGYVARRGRFVEVTPQGRSFLVERR